MRPTDLALVRDDLLHFRSEWESRVEREQLAAASLPRCLEVLDLIPESLASGDVLELGASPYLFTLCARRIFTGQVVLANYFGTEERTGTQRLVHERTGEELHLDYDVFDVEKDEFPYPDGSFDIVIFSELIEHLAINPVWTLSEIHRVLRPDGVVLLSTPNRLSIDRFDAYLSGVAPMVDKYSPVHGYGARHNREYCARELHELFTCTGYEVETLQHRELAARAWFPRARRFLLRSILSLFSAEPRDEHIFLRARRGAAFRWDFPPSLFDQLGLFQIARHPFVRMGENDPIQCLNGWQGREDWGARGGYVRRCEGEARVVLRAPERTTGVGVEVLVPRGSDQARGRLIVRDHWVGTSPEFEGTFLDRWADIPSGSWQTIESPLESGNAIPAGTWIDVVLDLPAGTAVRRVWLDSGQPTAD